MKTTQYILWYKDISKQDTPLVGGKNASLGEMFSKLTKKGINLPNGFATTASAFWYFLEYNKINKQLEKVFDEFNPNSIQSLKKTGKLARNLILRADFPKDLEQQILENYAKLSQKYALFETRKRTDLEEERSDGKGLTLRSVSTGIDVAIRSSATAEDLPSASFAGQHETFLNVRGEKDLLIAIRKAMASLFTDRAIAYREEKGFDHLTIALSVGIQKMIRSDLASSGVMFTMDTQTGFENIVLINSIYGIGEMIVQGKITSDEFFVFKPTLKKGYKSIISKKLGKKDKKYIYNKNNGLKQVSVSENNQNKFSITDEEVLLLAKWACEIEEHYKTPQDIEWAKDGKTGQLFIVQSRPETVHTGKTKAVHKEYKLKTKQKPILDGIAVGDKIGQGKARIIDDISKISKFKTGEVLITKMTDPDWVPIIRNAGAVITDQGSKVCHAAIVCRELGIPCIVGTLNASKVLKNNQFITVDCSQGSRGKIYLGKVDFEIKKYNLEKIPKLKTKIMVNIGAPEIAFKTSFLPTDGAGLVRLEFIIAEKIRIHPMTTIGYPDKEQFFIDKLAEGIAIIASAFYPKKVIVRFSDFKTNEYRNLIGGEIFEKQEANPMLGFRGASRYIDKKFQPAFKMECQAIKKARQEFGLENIAVMVPFCRTIKEAKQVMDLIKKFGIADEVKKYVMCEIPSNVILAEEFLEIFDGMSIGTNDLTQLSLGIDRDNAEIADIADARDETIKRMIEKVIKLCRKNKKYCGICGQAPSDYPEFAEFLVKQNIESISLTPDTIIKTILNLSKLEK